MDSSHDQLHFHNTAKYAFQIVTDILASEESVKLIKGQENRESIEQIVLAAYCHDLIDEKYMEDQKEAIAKLRHIFLKNGFSPDGFEVILYIITHISFSKRKLRKEQGLPLFEEHPYKFASQIVCDADQLDAYRVERVIEYQKTHPNSSVHWKVWCKTLLVKRVLRYISDYMNTESAKRIAQDLHKNVQHIVDTEFVGVEMIDY
jgi:hypothetical protein